MDVQHQVLAVVTVSFTVGTLYALWRYARWRRGGRR